ncbi:hypothetical protein EGX98_11965 [Fusobacterium necrophorum]|nr:hypothetical protein EGX98_11965 [Fusobacterium necrophorum]
MPPMCQGIEEIYRKFLNIFIFRYQYHFLLTNTLFFYNSPNTRNQLKKREVKIIFNLSFVYSLNCLQFISSSFPSFFNLFFSTAQ